MENDMNFTDLFDFFFSFVDMFFNEIFTPQMHGLMSYLFSCIPKYIQSYMVFVVVAVCLVALWNIITGKKGL